MLYTQYENGIYEYIRFHIDDDTILRTENDEEIVVGSNGFIYCDYLLDVSRLFCDLRSRRFFSSQI